MSIRDTIKEREKRSNKTVNARDYVYDKWRKKDGERFGLETLESDLASMNETVNRVIGEWQTQETMLNTRAAVENIHSRLGMYQEWQKEYGGADLSELSNTYKTVLDEWDNLSSRYKPYKDANAFTSEQKKLSELNSMTADELSKYLNEKNPIAYTTAMGQDIAWKDLYNEKADSEMAASKDGAKGWGKFLADENVKKEEAKAKEENKKWYDWIGEALGNTTDTTLPGATLSQTVSDKRKDDSYMKPTDDWTEEEQNTFGAYYLADPGKAYDYATRLNNAKAMESKNEQKQSVTNKATSSFWSGAGHTAGALLTAPLGLADYMDDLTDMAAGRPVVEESNLSPFEYSQAVTGGIGTYLNEEYGTLNENIPIIGGKGLGDAYGLGTSIAQSTMSAYTMGGAGALVSYFGQGAAAGMDDALDRGATDEQALIYGTILGAAEGVFESIGIEKLMKIGSAKTLKDLFVNTLKQSGAEGLEEFFTSISGNVADRFVMKDMSNLNKTIRQYMAQGLSEDEATKKAWLEMVEEVAYDAVGGFASGSVHAAPHIAVATANEYSQNKKTGEQIRANDRVGEMTDLFDTMEMQGLTPGESEAYKLYGEYLQKTDLDKLSNAKLGNLYRTTYRESMDTLESKKATDTQKTDAVKRMGKLNEIATSKPIDERQRQKRVEELNKGEVTKVNGTDGPANIQGIRIEDGSTIVLTSRGEAKAEDVTFSSNDAELVSYAEIMDSDKANLFLSQYDGKANVEQYEKSFDMVYAYGEAGIGVDTVLKNKGVLTEAQASAIYTNAVKMKSEARQKAIDEITAKYSKNVIVKGKFDDTIIDYNNKNADGTKVNWNTLSSTQRNAVRFAKAFSKATGINIVFSKSKVEHGKHKGEHGSYNPSTNTITLDVYAGRMNVSDAFDAIIPTLSHEVTHWMKAKSPELFAKMQEKVMNTLSENGMDVKEQLAVRKAEMERNHPDQTYTDEDVIDELVAKACEDMLSNSESARELLEGLTETEQKTFMDKVGEIFNNLIEWVNNLLSQYKSTSEEAEFLRKYEDKLKEAQKMWDAAFKDAVKANQALQAEGKTAEAAISESLKKNGVLTNGDNATVYSVRYILDEKTKDKVAADLVKTLGVTKTEADKYLEAETSIASIVLNPKHQEFLDYDADDGEVAIKKNSDYPQGTVDFSNICAKRRDFTSVMNRVMAKFKDHIFLSTDLAKIRTIMSEEKITILCGICYVEDRRQLDSIVAEDFIKALELYRNGSTTRPDGKPFNANQLKALKMVENDTYTPSIYELITLEGRNILKDKNSNMESAWVNYNNARGMQSVRLLTNEAEYKREILKYSPTEVKRKNDLGGLRIYSFSDAEIPHLIDLVQVITDSASKGLAIQGYTKVNWYAKMIRDTGVKLNRSLIPAGTLGYHMENGKAVLDYDTVEGIDINDKDFFDSTEYDNVGNILIGINEVQIRAAMLDQFVDYIIPFHTGQSGDVLEEKGIGKWQNYKNSQSERKLSDGKKSEKQINIYTDVIQRAESEGKPIKNKVQFVEKFLSVCKENGLIPRFSEFLNTDANGDYIYTEGYHKFIIDFKMFHPITGEYLPQKPVTPNFDNGFITQTLNDFAEQEKAKQIELQPKMDKAIARIENEVVKEQYSDRVHEYDQAEDNDLAEFVDSVANGNARSKDYRVISSHISDRLATEIQKIIGLNVSGYGNEIDKGQVEHILKEHGEHGRSDNSMADVGDIARIGYAIDNFDKIREGNNRSKYKNADGTKAKTVELQTRIGNEFYYVVEAVPVAKVKKLKVVSAYINKKDTFSEVAVSNDPSRYVQDESQSYVFNNIISDSAKKSTTPEQNSDREIDARTLLANALDTVAQTDEEKEKLASYKTKVERVNTYQFKLDAIRSQIRELGFKWNDEKVQKLRQEAEELEKKIDYYDRQLLKLEATEHLRQVVNRARKYARRQAVEKYKGNQEREAIIKSITNKSLMLNTWLQRPTKEKHVHLAMQPIVERLVKAIDFSSKRMLNGGEPTKNDISLAKALADVKEVLSTGTIDGEILYELYGSGLDDEVKKLLEAVNDIVREFGDNEFILNKMTLEELNTLDKVVSVVKASVNKMNRFHVANTKKAVSTIAQNDIQEMDELGQAKIYKSKFMKGVSHLINWNTINPYYAFKRFGDGGKLMFEALQDGWDKFAFNVKKIVEFTKKTYTEEDVKRWSEDVHEFKVLMPASEAEQADPDFKGNYKTIKLTTAQIMTLYCLQKREQAVGHLFGGGIGIADIETKDGVISQNFSVMLTEKELNKIIDELEKTDAKAIQVADSLQEFMGKDCAEWGNEISMARFGYRAFGEEAYFPIKSDPRVLKGKKDTPTEMEKSLYRLLNMSFTKALTDKANNRILVENIFDVFAQHTSEMAKYNALALPVLDAVRWFNYTEKGGKKSDGQFETKSLYESMLNAFGNDATNYVDTFLKDLNGADNVGRDRVAKGFFSNAKIASVGFNLKVAALQPTSYLRASAIIDPKYLTKGADPTKVKYGIEKAEEHCGIAYWKSLGFYDTNIQRGVAEIIKKDKSWKDKLTDKSMKMAEKMDKFTWGCLWNACEEEIKDTRRDLEVGSKEFYTAVGKRLREVIYTTQVVDSTMTRSQMMRSPDGLDKMFSAFASEPTLSYNMLMDVVSDWKLTERKSNKSEAFKQHKDKMLRVATAYTATNLVTALLETAFQAYRDDDDEEEDLAEYVISFLESFGSNMGITTKIPYVKDLISILQGFTSSRMDTQWMQNLTYAFKDWMKIFKGEGNLYKAVYRTLSTVSQVSGIAGGNAMRELVSAWNLTIGNIFPSLKLYK